MATTQRNFILGKMNKELDERLIKNGEYTDALNVKIMASGGSNDGTVRLSYGNTQLTTIEVGGLPLNDNAKCIGTFEDGSEETVYWFITTPFVSSHSSGRADLIVSFDISRSLLTYHVVSTQSATNAAQTTLNFSPNKLITSINKVGDLLFFTDGVNPPRKINVKRTYAKSTQAVNWLDLITPEELMVIKAPPVNAPAVKGLTLGTDDNYMEDRFISFAYRYKYLDGEYSATSQFSQAVFGAKPFNLDIGTGENIGAQNIFDAAEVVYNSGSDQVIGIDILYKELNDNTIKIAERINKSTTGTTNDTDYTFSFDGKKTYTILGDSEILRLYDNVPVTAEAQTIMSNRLVYGNYKEGYDMTTATGEEVSIDYDTYLSHSEQGFEDVPTTREGFGPKTIGGFSETSIPCKFQIDLTGKELKKGDVIAMTITFQSDPVNSNGTVTNVPTTDIDFSYTLRQDFAHADTLAWDSDFRAKIGTLATIKKVYDPSNPTSEDLSCEGNTLTDVFNCSLPSGSGSALLYATGNDTDNEPIVIESSWTDQIIHLSLPALHFVDSLTAPTSSGYGYIKVVDTSVQIVSPGNGQTLKSNRGYETAMVYMDDFGRSSTPQVSSNSNVSTHHRDSTTVNKINVNIPTSQVAPSWATRYKFVLKQTEDSYDTIYSTTYFREGGSSNTYFLIEGENAAKIEKGDKLFVKQDADGATNRSVSVTVLDKTVEEEGFKTFHDAAGVVVVPPSGVYMKINASKFASETSATGAFEVEVEKGKSLGWSTDEESMYPTAVFGPFGKLVSGTYVPEPIPAGTRVNMDLLFKREGPGDGNNLCEKRKYDLEQTLVASRDYDSFESWWIGDDVKSTLNSGVTELGLNGDEINNEMAFEGFLMSLADYEAGNMPYSVGTNYYQFVIHTSGEVFLHVRGTRSCGSSLKKRSTVSGSITVSASGGSIAFETKAELASEGIWFENEQSFAITGGLHEGNLQNQTSSVPAQVELSFTNAICFGDGVESMKINDSLIGNRMGLGHRVHSTVDIDFKQAHRFADLTYSGVINDESNINRLNEFNGGLLNFKALEDSFGEIKVIDARRTDILVLQEDKISTVMAGKNLLSMSDSVKGGALLSVPDVMGTQIARQEEFGISDNPESYVSYGNTKYFTDVKRGAVLMMNGDQLTNIAEAGMSTFFKDSFTADANTLKIGGYDSFSEEYVLHNSSTINGEDSFIIPCGADVAISLEANEQVTFVIGYGDTLGSAITNITTTDSSFVTIQSIVEGSATSNSFSGAGVHSSTATKTSMTAETITYTLTSDIDTTINVNFACIVPVEYTVVQVVLTDASNEGKTTTARYSTERADYTSSVIDTPVLFDGGLGVTNNTILSLDRHLTGVRGGGAIPLAGDTINVGVVKRQYNDFAFDLTANSIGARQLTNSLDITVPANLTALLSILTDVTNVAEVVNTNGDVEVGGSFTLSASAGSHLYVVYDLRTFSDSLISFDATSVAEACCNQECEAGTCGTYRLDNGRTTSVTFTHTDCSGAGTSTVLAGGASVDVCSTTYPSSSVASDKILISLMDCNCS